MSAEIYDVGDKIRMTATFSGDPQNVRLDLYNGRSLVRQWVYGVDPELIKDSPGHFHLDYISDTVGYYHYEFNGSGSIFASGSGFFILSGS